MTSNMTAVQVRQAYLDFFTQKKGHKYVVVMFDIFVFLEFVKSTHRASLVVTRPELAIDGGVCVDVDVRGPLSSLSVPSSLLVLSYRGITMQSSSPESVESG